MKKLALFSALGIFLIGSPSVFAGNPRYERSISLPPLSGSQPVFIAVPETVLLYNPVDALRIWEDGAVIAHKTQESQKGDLSGVIATVELCSVESGGMVGALHDGDLGSFVRPDPLGNPASCTMTVSLSFPVRVDSVRLDADQPFAKLGVSAKKDDGSFVSLREEKNAQSLSFSSVVTSSLRFDLTYEVVPKIAELTLGGETPARLLFIAKPGAHYALVYGDETPAALPVTPESLFAMSTTPYAIIGSERIRQEDPDGDGIVSANDNCPFVANPVQSDKDSDGVGDACDNAPLLANAPQNDRDNDGVGDLQDNCPALFNPDQRDDDLDGIGFLCDDDDGDGVINAEDNCRGLSNPNQQDLDANGVGDACELDRDSDGTPDSEDNCRGTPNPKQEDRDEDRIGDACDVCPDAKNPEQEDQNENGIGDACEDKLLDPDGDKVQSGKDNCPALPNPDQSDTDKDGRGDFCDNCPTLQNPDQADANTDGQGDVCTDGDGDGFLPHIDNCPAIANPDQADRDNDGAGDACEDDDGDGVMNSTDNCKYVNNHDQMDQDLDGSGDACDKEDSRFSEQHPWVMWTGMSFIILLLLGMVAMMVLRIQKDMKKNGNQSKDGGGTA